MRNLFKKYGHFKSRLDEVLIKDWFLYYLLNKNASVVVNVTIDKRKKKPLIKCNKKDIYIMNSTLYLE